MLVFEICIFENEPPHSEKDWEDFFQNIVITLVMIILIVIHVEEMLNNHDGDTVSLEVSALVCDNCGERYYELKTMKKFELIKQQLKSKQTQDLILTGKSYLLN